MRIRKDLVQLLEYSRRSQMGWHSSSLLLPGLMSLHSLLPQQIEVLLQLFHWSVLHFRSTPALMVVVVPAMVHVGVISRPQSPAVDPG